jgi:hypothetical protein
MTDRRPLDLSDREERTMSDSNPTILTTFDAATGAVTYSPKSVTIPAAPAPATITMTIQTINQPAGGSDATFYGFAIRSGWLPVMSVSMNATEIEITDPNTLDDPIPGNFGFIALVQAPDGMGVVSNPDPTIYNEPIG